MSDYVIPANSLHVGDVIHVSSDQVGYLVTGEHCNRCGDTNYDPDTRVCLTCAYPDDPSSRAYLVVED